jgi:transposase
MVEYTTEPSALEHRCQCCGEIAEDVFCEECQEHINAEAQAAADEDQE